jgi:ABC-type lipoprotein release transport system permease subunit
MLFHVSARDPWTVAAVLAMLAAVAMLAAWVPSRRAARVNPVEALRQE